MTSTRKKSTCSRSSATVSRSRELSAVCHPVVSSVRTRSMMTSHLGRRLRHVEPRHQQSRHALLLSQQRAPRRFGRMRREHRLDAQAPEQRDDLLERDTVLLQPVKAVVQAAGLRSRVRIDVLPPAPDAVHLFGHVHDLEPGRKGADQLEGFRRWTTLRAHDQGHTVFGVAFATTDRRLAIAFHRIEYAQRRTDPATPRRRGARARARRHAARRPWAERICPCVAWQGRNPISKDRDNLDLGDPTVAAAEPPLGRIPVKVSALRSYTVPGRCSESSP